MTIWIFSAGEFKFWWRAWKSRVHFVCSLKFTSLNPAIEELWLRGAVKRQFLLIYRVAGGISNFSNLFFISLVRNRPSASPPSPPLIAADFWINIFLFPSQMASPVSASPQLPILLSNFRINSSLIKLAKRPSLARGSRASSKFLFAFAVVLQASHKH